MKLSSSVWALAALGLAACGGGEGEAQASSVPGDGMMAVGGEAAETSAPNTSGLDPIAASVKHPGRPAEDVERDASRKPGATMRFAGIGKGITVLELEAGAGYYTELISRAVGPNGTVYMQNPPGFDGFLGNALEDRLGDDRLPNVVTMRTNFDGLDAPAGSVDVVTWFQGPHELWFFPESTPEGFGDPEATFEKIAGVLKPGGALVVVDHRAADGAGPAAGGTLHRIEEQVVVDLAEGAGLMLTKTSDILANPDDPLDVSVFDESVRGETDQFLLYFEKPE